MVLLLLLLLVLLLLLLSLLCDCYLHSKLVIGSLYKCMLLDASTARGTFWQTYHAHAAG